MGKREFKLVAHFPNLKAGKTKTKGQGIIEGDRVVSFYSREDALTDAWFKNKSWENYLRDYFIEQRKYEVREMLVREKDE